MRVGVIRKKKPPADTYPQIIWGLSHPTEAPDIKPDGRSWPVIMSAFGPFFATSCHPPTYT